MHVHIPNCFLSSNPVGQMRKYVLVAAIGASWSFENRETGVALSTARARTNFSFMWVLGGVRMGEILPGLFLVSSAKWEGPSQQLQGDCAVSSMRFLGTQVPRCCAHAPEP